MRKFLFWVVFNIPLGPLGPWILGLALGHMPYKVPSQGIKDDSE